MKTTQTLIAIAAFFTLALPAAAIEGLKISLQSSNVVLSWPSVETETYIVQYRSAFGTNTPWQTLTNNLPADPGTNLTVFYHSNQVSGAFSSGGSGGGGGSPPSPSFATTQSSPTDSTSKQEKQPKKHEMPPLPWDEKTWSTSPKKDSSTVVTLDGGINSDSPSSCGFYQVVRNGAHIVGITNGMTLSGVLTIVLEAGNDAGELSSVSMIENGVSVSDISIQTRPFSFPLSVKIDTTQMTNGVHQISARATWDLPGEDGDSGLPSYQADSPVVEVNIYNEISFPDWMPTFGQDSDSLLITAQSAHPDADWYIDVYGAQTNYIGTFSGHTTDGIIGVVWNLIGPQSEYHDDPFFLFAVRTEFNNASAIAVAPRTRKNYDRWTGRGHWVVANQLAWANVVGGDEFETMTDGFVGAAEAQNLTVRPAHAAGEAFRIRFGGTGTQPDSDWVAFRQALIHPESRNLFYHGHGEGAGIGRNRNNLDRYIPATEIGIVLHTIPAGQTNRHGFRFVFLDGCETATGSFPEAFGIVHKENLTADYYNASGERASAFIGWNKSPAAAYANSAAVNHVHYIQNFLYLWQTGNAIRQALDLAKDGPLVHNTGINPNHLTVFGYKDLYYLTGNGN